MKYNKVQSDRNQIWIGWTCYCAIFLVSPCRSGFWRFICDFFTFKDIYLEFSISNLDLFCFKMCIQTKPNDVYSNAQLYYGVIKLTSANHKVTHFFIREKVKRGQNLEERFMYWLFFRTKKKRKRFHLSKSRSYHYFL